MIEIEWFVRGKTMTINNLSKALVALGTAIKLSHVAGSLSNHFR